ncbi:dihydrofolate reductase family protein [Pseudomonas flexibilis]|uniref:dihydrofolate reductase family protein n=1 Tax=Pseudomonas flexibilis TaxID=706570 RepID=UPI00068E6707|nr:dihydrofolate reductase family protein [Pseudomonas flexibilis]SCY50650.1 Dihydrofolate reductase [Pseudomonas flexibilis]
MKFSVFVATSLDGYVADAHGGIGWLLDLTRQVPEGEDCGYQEFLAGMDALVFGRRALEQALCFPEWPYGDKPVFVVCPEWASLPDGVPASVSLTNRSPRELARLLEKQGFGHAFLDDESLIRGCLRQGLIDTITLTTVPMLLGNGVSLFGRSGVAASLQLEASQSYPFGFVQNRYRVLT